VQVYPSPVHPDPSVWPIVLFAQRPFWLGLLRLRRDVSDRVLALLGSLSAGDLGVRVGHLVPQG
jgi:hypothetical protein